MITCDGCGQSAEAEAHLGYSWAVSDPDLNAEGFHHLCGCCNHVYHMTKAYRGSQAGREYLEGLQRLHENPVSV